MAQAVDGSLGMGFGVTSSSLLLSLGVGSALTSASVHIAELVTTSISGVSHFRIGNVEKRLFWPLLVSGVAGAVGGTLSAVTFQDAPAIRVVVAGILLVLGVMIVVRFARRRQHRHAVPSPRRLLFIGFPAAFIDALGGGGWGPIATPSLLMSNVDPAKAVGTVNAVEFFVTLTISARVPCRPARGGLGHRHPAGRGRGRDGTVRGVRDKKDADARPGHGRRHRHHPAERADDRARPVPLGRSYASSSSAPSPLAALAAAIIFVCRCVGTSS